MKTPPAALAMLLGLAACGGRLEREALAELEPVATAFAADLDAQRFDAARRRMTPAFRQPPLAESVAMVARQQAAQLGRLKSRESAALTDVVGGASSPPKAVSASASWTGRFEKGDARVTAKFVRGDDGAWLVDAWVVEGAVFTFALK